MRTALFACLVAAGCMEHGSASSGDDCGERGCASLPGTLTLTVLDSTTNQPVAGTPTFTAGPQTLPFACSVVVDPGAACPAWQLSYEGAFDVAVAAAGYQTGTIHVVIEGPAACCGVGPNSSASLSLVPL
jgi:hypothetical protein